MSEKEKKILRDRVERKEKLSDEDEFLYMTEVLGMSGENAKLAINLENIQQDQKEKGFKVYL